jgi:hypothetical protein
LGFYQGEKNIKVTGSWQRQKKRKNLAVAGIELDDWQRRRINEQSVKNK